MAFKRYSSKARRAIRPTGTRAAKKKAGSRFGFKKFMKAYPSAQTALEKSNRMAYNRPSVPFYLRTGMPYSRIRGPTLAPYGQVIHPLQQFSLPKVVDLATATKARLVSSTFKTMAFEEEHIYSQSFFESPADKANICVRFLWQIKLSVADLITSVLKKHLDRFKEVKDMDYITFDRLSVKMRFYRHPRCGSMPYHGYNWDPASSMLIESDKVPMNLEFGKSYNGKGFMSLKFNITGFVVKNGGSPYIKFSPSIDLAGIKQTLNLAPNLHLYSHFPTEIVPTKEIPQVGRTVTKIYYRLHKNDMRDAIRQTVSTRAEAQMSSALDKLAKTK